jgi:hypothetical protein
MILNIEKQMTSSKCEVRGTGSLLHVAQCSKKFWTLGSFSIEVLVFNASLLAHLLQSN